jgi:catechol 2,3-dioxygenase-like lactoylglutathione lyase family enzyme
LEKRRAPAAVSVNAMLKRITHTFIHVLDQDEALDFYVGKLGMVLGTDADLGFVRWLTVSPPDQPDLELGLMLPGPPAYDDETAEEIRELVSKGAAGGGDEDVICWHTVKRTTVKLPDDLDARLRHEAQRRGTTIAEITRTALEEHIGAGPRRRLVAAAAGRSGRTEISEQIEEIIAAETGQSR